MGSINRVTAPYGTWTSRVTPQAVAAAALRLSSVALDGDDIYWIEGRPDEGGRQVLVKRRADGVITDVTPPATNVRTRVHEYGGAAYIVSGGVVYYSEFADQRLYRMEAGGQKDAAARREQVGAPEPLTPPGDWYFADVTMDPRRPRLVCVREDHTTKGREAVTTLVSLPLPNPTDVPQAVGGTLAAGEVIVSGHDFYATPRFSPDGSRLAWLAWRHPNMPWDGTELWVADVEQDDAGRLGPPQLVAGGDSESIFQPGWSPDGALYFVSDRTGWWNLYRLGGADRPGRSSWPGGSDGVLVCGMPAEFGRPQWVLGMSTWAFADPTRLVVSYQQLGRWHLATIDVRTGSCVRVPTELEPGENLTATRTHAVFVGGAIAAPDAIVRVNLATGDAETIRTASAAAIDRASAAVLDPVDHSPPEPIDFPTADGLTAHAFYYAPRNPDFVAPAGERPPLIVISHGGPTASTSPRLNLDVQYWTSRGFAVVDVNYGGSSGFGRAYRQRLNGRWGIVDVADCVNAAVYLSTQSRADPDRLIIRGRSAGGYTTLATLTFRPGVFKAGASYYGVSDLEALARDTHKFESRYLDNLVGPYPARRDLYRDRSPVHFADRLACPVIFFQGADDRVVPPDQSKAMADALVARGLRTELLLFEGEQHGFRRRETIIRCLEAELAFYAAVFGLG